jgi:hypothetical protein
MFMLCSPYRQGIQCHILTFAPTSTSCQTRRIMRPLSATPTWDNGISSATFFTSASMTSDTLLNRPSKGISNRHLKGRSGPRGALSSLARTSSGHNSDMTKALGLPRRFLSTVKGMMLRASIAVEHSNLRLMRFAYNREIVLFPTP